MDGWKIRKNDENNQRVVVYSSATTRFCQSSIQNHPNELLLYRWVVKMSFWGQMINKQDESLLVSTKTSIIQIALGVVFNETRNFLSVIRRFLQPANDVFVNIFCETDKIISASLLW